MPALKKFFCGLVWLMLICGLCSCGWYTESDLKDAEDYGYWEGYDAGYSAARQKLRTVISCSISSRDFSCIPISPHFFAASG